jgi:hypothetical protein
MDPTAALAIALALAALIVAAFGKSRTKTLISGVLTRDRKGRLCLVLTPAPKTTRRGKQRSKRRGKGGGSA